MSVRQCVCVCVCIYIFVILILRVISMFARHFVTFMLYMDLLRFFLFFDWYICFCSILQLVWIYAGFLYIWWTIELVGGLFCHSCLSAHLELVMAVRVLLGWYTIYLFIMYAILIWVSNLSCGIGIDGFSVDWMEEFVNRWASVIPACLLAMYGCTMKWALIHGWFVRLV